MELYRQLQPNDPVLTNGEDLAIFKEIIADNRLHLFLLEDGDEIKSTCYLNIIPNITRSASPCGIIENVVTDAEARRAGYGKRIIGHSLDAGFQAMTNRHSSPGVLAGKDGLKPYVWFWSKSV